MKSDRELRLEALLRESVEPGVFGPWPLHLDPQFAPGSFAGGSFAGGALEAICERFGYGAVMHHVSALWERKHPGAAHSVAACTSVRRDYIERVGEILAED